MSFEIRISRSAIRNCVALALLTVAPVAGATGALDSVLTIRMDKKAYLMGEDIKVIGVITNPLRQNLIIGFPLYIYNILQLSKLKSYGSPLLIEGEPKAVKRLTADFMDLLHINIGAKCPPNFRDSSTVFIVPSMEYPYGLNPGAYSLQIFVRGGPPPRGGWWSNVVEFEVLEPQGVEAKAWKLLSKVFKKIEPLKVKERAIPSNTYAKGEPYRDSMEQIREEGYTQVIKRYPHTACAQYAVPHLRALYDEKINYRIVWGQFDIAKEIAKEVVPDSLNERYQVYINEKEKDFIQRKEEFRIKMLKEQEENLRKKLKTKR